MKLPAHLSYGPKLVLLVVGLPLLVAILGSWQMARTPDEADLAAKRAEIQQTIEALRQLQQEKGSRHVMASHPTVRQRMEALRVEPTEDFFAGIRATHYSGLLQELGLMPI